MNGFRGYSSGYGIIPPVVKTLLLANAAVYLLLILLPVNLGIIFGLVPRFVWSKFFIWQLFTYMFLHGGLMHILMNMFILWMFGSDLERDWGSAAFLKYYLLCGVGGGLFNVALQPNSLIPIVGASGAIYGILAAFAMTYPNRLIYLYFIVPVPAKYMVIGMALLEFILSMNPNSNVAHFAHLGGMLVGFIYLKSNWRFGNFGSGIAQYFRRKKMERHWREVEKEHRLMEEVDAILDKINKVGYENLTRHEKKILEEASNRLAKK